MARKNTPTSRKARSTGVTVTAQPLTSAMESRLAPVIGSELALAKLPGDGGKVTLANGVTRITGRNYTTATGTVPAAEIYFVEGSQPRDDGPWPGKADKLAWIDPATGYECIVMRDNPAGYLSGFVGVPEFHPLFGWNHEAITTRKDGREDADSATGRMIKAGTVCPWCPEPLIADAIVCDDIEGAFVEVKVYGASLEVKLRGGGFGFCSAIEIC